MIDIEALIADAQKRQSKDELKVFRLIKTEMVKKQTEEGRKTKTLSDEEVDDILVKMVTQRNDSIKAYEQNNRSDLADIERKELSILSKFAPKQASDEEIAAFAQEVIAEYVKTQYEAKNEAFKLSMADMGKILPKVKARYPKESNTGKIVSVTLKKNI